MARRAAVFTPRPGRLSEAPPSAPVPPPLMEPLEARALLFSGAMLSNLPPLSALESPNNSVVRFHTNYGVIDIELFNSTAPTTVQNFTEYVMEGAYDGMFFHRLVKNFVLQGGGFKFTDEGGKTDIATDPPIQNEFLRPNNIRTVAMAKTSDPNSATSQFFFNLKSNASLNNPLNSGGFTVFGRVITGWSAVETIAGLQVADLDHGLTGMDPDPGVFDTVPVGDGPAPSEQALVMVWDAEVIKRAGVGVFFGHAVYYPEGWRGSTIVERVDLVNPIVAKNYYQIIARYENGERDEVIHTGVIEPRGHRTVKLSDFNMPGLNLVRPGVGYALEVRSTHALGASLNHRDFGVTIGEAFVRVEPLDEASLSRWTFGYGEEGPAFNSFLVMQNLTEREVDVTVTVHFVSGAPQTFTVPLDRYARGGLNLGAPGVLPNGTFSVEVASPVPIVAAMSVYEQTGTAFTDTTNGSAAVGTLGGGATEGYLAAARIATGGSSSLSFVYTAPSPSAIIVDVFFYLNNGTVLTSPNPVLLTASGRRIDRALASFGVSLPANTFFSVGYKVRNDAAPVSVTYLSKHVGDTHSTGFTTVSNAQLLFGDGFMDAGLAGTTYSEIISVFNPYARPDVTFAYRVIFRFSDGATIQGAAGVLGPNGRADVRPHLIPEVLAKVNSSPAFKFYSISVETLHNGAAGPFLGAAVAQLTRIHAQASWRQTMTSQPTLAAGAPIFFMSDPSLDPP